MYRLVQLHVADSRLNLCGQIGKKNFCTTYANKGWSASRYAIAFKYQTGSLLAYALKKREADA